MQQLFILGNPRSGTSLLRLMLNNHQDIVVPPESGFLLWWYPKYKDWTWKDSKDDAKVKAYVADVLSSKKIETWQLDADKLRLQILIAQPEDYLSLNQQVYLAYAALDNKSPQWVGDKNNYYIHHLQELHQIAPQAKYIHLVRDGRDVACSYKAIAVLKTDSPYKPVLPTNIAEIAQEWVANNNRITHFLSGVQPGQQLRIRYEDLIDDPTFWLSKVCFFLGITFDQQMLQYYMQQSSKLEPGKTLDWKRKTLEKPDKDNIGKYKQLLTEEEQHLFNRAACTSLQYYGYSN